ncbi:putative phosphoserine phosphatase [Pseudoalteromonas tunicata D2]|uniref:Phosphoserine phosphatase n=2 Tax=Pseudoalteromonas tunicata TaxID=314281 RepID=A4C6W9_9GAMM|nr:putative phosphoserine phosphatase [Pseudoalteromonas tunicata D2]
MTAAVYGQSSLEIFFIGVFMPMLDWSALVSQVTEQTLVLNQWYRSRLMNDGDVLPPNNEVQYLVAFDGELNAAVLTQLHAFLNEQHITDCQVCLYQPLSELKPALAIAFSPENPIVRERFELLQTEVSLQLALFSTPPTLSQPGLLVMDMDSTAIEIECIDEIARLAGVYDEVSQVTAQAMQGALEFSESLRLRVAKLEGVEQVLIDQLKAQLPLMHGVQSLCSVLKQHNWKLAIASGGFIPFAQQVQSLLELDAIHANELESKDGALTGRVLGTIVDAEEKRNFLLRYADQLGLSLSQTVAMGDGANDLKMMHCAGLGVAVHGKPLVAKMADVAVQHGSLLQVIYFLALPPLA